MEDIDVVHHHPKGVDGPFYSSSTFLDMYLFLLYIVSLASLMPMLPISLYLGSPPSYIV